MIPQMNLRRNLPIAGIVAFSLCSTWSIRHLLATNAKHDTDLFWIPAVAIELFTAWAIYNVVEQARLVTRSNISKQDRRFYALVLALFASVAIPTLAASIVANTAEFGGNVLLGSLFPIACIGCAIGAALPETVHRHETRRQADADERKADAKRRKEERQRAQEQRKRLSSLGNMEATFVQLCQDPSQTQANIAQKLSISRQTVSNHLSKLEQLGAIRRNGEGVEILWNIAVPQ